VRNHREDPFGSLIAPPLGYAVQLAQHHPQRKDGGWRFLRLLAVLFALLIFAVVIAVAGWHSAARAILPQP
jgi:hypothetical protein